MEENLKHKAVSGVLWKIGEYGGKQLISFVTSVVLARLIMPDQFGMVAMLSVFTAIASIIIDSGFSAALIRKPDRTDEDCSTIYWFNILVSIFCYFILFLSAPLIADFYNMHELISILRVSSLGIVIGSFAGVHGTLLRADMRFKELTKFNLVGLLVSAIVGISTAYMDFKVWAIVCQNLTLTTFTTIILIKKVKWRPTLTFSRKSFKEFYGFGWKMMASTILATLYNNIYSIIIGKVYNASDLAFYNRAFSLTNLTAETPTGILQSVTYPMLSKLQDNDLHLANAYRRSIKISCFIIFPLCLGIGAVAYPLINVLYTDRWITAATLLTIIVFGQLWFPIHAINLNYLMVKGRSDLYFRLEVIKKILGVIIIAATAPFGLIILCWGSVASSIISLFLNTYYTGKFLNMGIIAQLKDVMHILILSLIMFVAARAVATLMGNGILSLLCSVATGIVVYVAGALLCRFPEVTELKNLRK